MKILMVCLGNICRSPLAEGIMRLKANEAGLDWEIDSAGTGSWHLGKQPDTRSIDIAHVHNINIENQKARQFKVEDFDAFDRIYVMDSSNYKDVCKLARTDADKEKVELIMNEYSPGMNTNVPDPYHDNDGFQVVYTMLDQACDSVLNKYW